MRSAVRDGVDNRADDHADGRAGEPPTPSMVRKAVAVLAAFGPRDAECSQAELARRTGIPKPTVHRLVHQLVDCGLLEQSPSGIRLGMRLFELGLLVPRQRNLRDAALPFLRDLHEVTRETVHLAVLDGPGVLYVEKLTGWDGPPLPSRLGGRMPAYCTGVGKALLAYQPTSVVDRIVDAGLVRRTSRTKVEPGVFLRELARVRARGVAFEFGESVPGISCVAAPVLVERGVAVAAVSITGWSSRLNTSRLAPAVRTAALGLSRQLRACP